MKGGPEDPSTKLVMKQEQMEMLESSITKPIPISQDEAPLSDWILDMTDPRLNDNRQPQLFAFLSIFKAFQQLLLLSRCQGITFGYFLDCLEQLFLLLNSCGFGNLISRIVRIQVKKEYRGRGRKVRARASRDSS